MEVTEVLRQDKAPAPLDAVAAMLDALVSRDVDGVIERFDPGPDTYVFTEGAPRWSNKGGDRIRHGWRLYFDTPIRLRGWAWQEGPEVQVGKDLALVAGIVRYEFNVNDEERPFSLRMSWVLRRREDHWRIVHEHGSQPLEDPYGTGDWWPESGSADVRTAL